MVKKCLSSSCTNGVTPARRGEKSVALNSSRSTYTQSSYHAPSQLKIFWWVIPIAFGLSACGDDEPTGDDNDYSKSDSSLPNALADEFNECGTNHSGNCAAEPQDDNQDYIPDHVVLSCDDVLNCDLTEDDSPATDPIDSQSPFYQHQQFKIHVDRTVECLSLAQINSNRMAIAWHASNQIFLGSFDIPSQPQRIDNIDNGLIAEGEHDRRSNCDIDNALQTIDSNYLHVLWLGITDNRYALYSKKTRIDGFEGESQLVHEFPMPAQIGNQNAHIVTQKKIDDNRVAMAWIDRDKVYGQILNISDNTFHYDEPVVLNDRMQIDMSELHLMQPHIVDFDLENIRVVWSQIDSQNLDASPVIKDALWTIDDGNSHAEIHRASASQFWASGISAEDSSLIYTNDNGTYITAMSDDIAAMNSSSDVPMDQPYIYQSNDGYVLAAWKSSSEMPDQTTLYSAYTYRNVGDMFPGHALMDIPSDSDVSYAHFGNIFSIAHIHELGQRIIIDAYQLAEGF